MPVRALKFLPYFAGGALDWAPDARTGRPHAARFPREPQLGVLARSASLAGLVRAESLYSLRAGRLQASRLGRPEPPQCLLPQLDLLDLSRPGHREIVHEDHGARDLEARDAAAAVREDVLLAQRVAGLTAHEGDADLAQARVRVAHHGRQVDRRMAHQEGLD